MLAASALAAYVTRALSVARFTAACCTPGTFFSARSTRATQLAQVMPPTPKSKDSEEERSVLMMNAVKKLRKPRNRAARAMKKTGLRAGLFTGVPVVPGFH